MVIMHSVTTLFNENMAFTSTINGHEVRMDTIADDGGDNSGPGSERLMLASLAGCIGMDVVSIPGKMKLNFSNFSVDINVRVIDEHPKYYDRVKLTYNLKVDAADQAKVQKVIALSQEKYCAVTAMFRKFAELETAILYLD